MVILAFAQSAVAIELECVDQYDDEFEHPKFVHERAVNEQQREAFKRAEAQKDRLKLRLLVVAALGKDLVW